MNTKSKKQDAESVKILKKIKIFFKTIIKKTGDIKEFIDVVRLRELKVVARAIHMRGYSRLTKQLLLDGMYVHFCFEYNPVCFKCGFDRNNDSSWNISNDIYNLIGILCYNETNKLRCKGCLEPIR